MNEEESAITKNHPKKEDVLEELVITDLATNDQNSTKQFCMPRKTDIWRLELSPLLINPWNQHFERCKIDKIDLSKVEDLGCDFTLIEQQGFTPLTALKNLRMICREINGDEQRFNSYSQTREILHHLRDF